MELRPKIARALSPSVLLGATVLCFLLTHGRYLGSLLSANVAHSVLVRRAVFATKLPPEFWFFNDRLDCVDSGCSGIALALRLFSFAAKMHPLSPGALRLVGFSHLLRRDYAAAEECFERVGRMNPRDLIARLFMAHVAGASGAGERRSDLCRDLPFLVEGLVTRAIQCQNRNEL